MNRMVSDDPVCLSSTGKSYMNVNYLTLNKNFVIYILPKSMAIKQKRSMPATYVNQLLYKSLPALLVLVAACLGIILPDYLSEPYSLSAEVSIETETSENDDTGKCAPSFPMRLSTHPFDKEQVSILSAVVSANNFLHYRESVRAPPQRYLAHS